MSRNGHKQLRKSEQAFPDLLTNRENPKTASIMNFGGPSPYPLDSETETSFRQRLLLSALAPQKSEARLTSSLRQQRELGATIEIDLPQEGTDFQRLCHQVAFNRFLARVISIPTRNWALKGGYAMVLRFVTARSTRDVDFTLRAGDTDSALEHLQRAGALVEDFFSFRVGEAMMES